AGEADRDVLDGQPGDDRDPVPLAHAVVRHLVPGHLEGQVRELVVAALRLLDRQDVGAGAVEERQDAVEAGTDGVDVPGGQAHGRRLPVGALQPSPHRTTPCAAAWLSTSAASPSSAAR